MIVICYQCTMNQGYVHSHFSLSSINQLKVVFFVALKMECNKSGLVKK
jgi:hypothetical protein